MLSNVCIICGDLVSEQRGNLSICLACFVFFRRSIASKKKYVCRKDGRCEIHLDTRSNCRSCRMKKCMKQGLQLDCKATKRRERAGPRKCSYKYLLDENVASTSTSEETFISSVDIPDPVMLQRLQQKQHVCHRKYRVVSEEKLATPTDINYILSLSFKNATEYAMQFSAFRKLSKSEKVLVLSEYAFAYMLIDQAFKTSQEAGNEEVWLLQNDTVLTRQIGEDGEFTKTLIETLARPFRNLKVDRIECVSLKTLLLVTPSIPGNVLFKGNDTIKFQFLSHLMNYSMRKFPETGAERFGEVLMLMSAIRSAIKEFYNQTRVPGIFELKNIDPLIRKRMLS